MSNKLNKKFLSSILIFISLVIIYAYAIEYKLGHTPCKLCLYERIPYFLSALLIAKILFFEKYEKMTLLIISLVFTLSAALAFYHFGIEQGFFTESFACKTEDFSNTISKEELLEKLKDNTVSCKEVNFKILGLSLAAINTIISVILSVIFIRLFMNYGKN